jgi:hypothetical protein
MTMITLLDLWLPILLSAVIVFVASSIIWMATPIHKHDYKDPGDKQPGLLEALRTAGLGTGVYFLPWCGADRNSPEAKERFKAGPWAIINVMGSAPSMGRNLAMWMLHLVIVGIFVGYITSNAGLPRGSAYFLVFRIAATTALLAHAGYALPMSIWHGQPLRQIPGRLFDGVVYALLTGGCFAGFWPAKIEAFE